MIRAITDSISQLIHTAFPDYVIYDDGKVPQNFTRPSFCIVPGKGRHTHLNIRVTQHDITYTIFLFPVLDESGAASLHGLQESLDKLCGLFAQGYVKIGKRAAKLKGAVMSDCSEQDGYAEFTLQYTSSSGERTAETMKNINIKEL